MSDDAEPSKQSLMWLVLYALLAIIILTVVVSGILKVLLK